MSRDQETDARTEPRPAFEPQRASTQPEPQRPVALDPNDPNPPAPPQSQPSKDSGAGFGSFG